ncbi:S-adenosyl-L-methionine-dependent methyltransferase [Paxillus ammoniavirescens]|nr:S-adenosyl-L-methionine-dependent methyltransferase [Paxillus ammoniavirescens]
MTAEGTEWDAPFGFRDELEVVISRLSSNGNALALAPEPRSSWVIVTPFALPGETIRVRVYRSSRLHSFADLLDVLSPNSELRDSSRVTCKYFGKCSGCQYQMLSYQKQLEIKQDVVIKAYQNFSNIPASAVPTVLPTIGSPKQYHYRTKITPHFEAPPKKARLEQSSNSSDNSKPDWLKIGFNQIGKRTVMDIEECPIATPVLNEAMGPIRENIINNIWSYKKGVSLLLRDSLDPLTSANGDAATVDVLSSQLEKHVCITDHKATVREKVGDKYFEFPGHSFFQNNNSILVPLTDYVRDAIFPASPEFQRPTHLVDAYCGSGLFSIMLSPHFTTVAGIELSADSIKFATHNARLNDLPEGKCTFRAGDAANIFSVVGNFPREHTALIIDPPRKGCDANFIEQLLAFQCRTVVYVSCNVHTQARDVGMILEKMKSVGDGRTRYVLESLRGFDLFPQTAHVESVAVLRLVEGGI